MTENQELLDHIIAAIREKKGKAIRSVDLSKLDSRICDCFLICEGSSNTQIQAISESIHDYVRDHIHVKPYAVEGTRNALWVAMDYGNVMVHIFDRATRSYYDLDHLWSDAVLTDYPDEI